MIWLSPMAGTEEGSVYFDIRDIAIQPNGTTTDGLIRGVLGDGVREVWGEILLGKNRQARILPVWTDDGQMETLSTLVDEELLQEQLLVAVETLFSSLNDWSGLPHFARSGHTTNKTVEKRWLAA